MSKKLSTKKGIFNKYRADFLINYNAKGVQYNRWVSTNGLDMSYTRGSSGPEDALSQYRVGGNYNCWYNPADPSVAVLVHRHNWASMLPLLIPTLVGLAALYFLIINALQLRSEWQDEKQRNANKKN